MTVLERRDYMKFYMRQYRAGRRLRGRKPARPTFVTQVGHCTKCGHLWPFGGRCPMCALEAPVAGAMSDIQRQRLLAAWTELMEVLQ